MECFQKQTIENKIEGGELHLRDLCINGRKYSLRINNYDDRLSLNFNEGEYEIIINEDGIRFERIVKRLNHDHDDVESLQVVVDPKQTLSKDAKKRDLVWRSRYPYDGEGYNLFYIPFGNEM